MTKIHFEEERREKAEKIEILGNLSEDKEIKTPRVERNIQAPLTKAERFFGFNR